LANFANFEIYEKKTITLITIILKK